MDKEAWVAKLVYIATHGPDDPTKACMPFHLAVNGAAAAGIEAQVHLAGDATLLIQDHVIASLQPVGFPPLADLVAGAIDKGVPIVV
jgi:predicted peroxiredoxin